MAAPPASISRRRPPSHAAGVAACHCRRPLPIFVTSIQLARPRPSLSSRPRQPCAAGHNYSSPVCLPLSTTMTTSRGRQAFAGLPQPPTFLGSPPPFVTGHRRRWEGRSRNFAKERSDSDPFHKPVYDLILALVRALFGQVREVGEHSEVFRSIGEKDKEKLRTLGKELSDVLPYLVSLYGICGIDLVEAALRMKDNASMNPVKPCKGPSRASEGDDKGKGRNPNYFKNCGHG